MLVNLSKLHGWRHCVYLGEEGDVRDLTLDFVELYVGKPSRMKNDDGTDNEDAMSETEFTSAFLWVNEHFAFVSPDEANVGPFDIDRFFGWVKAFEDERGVKFDTTVVDPWNDLAVDLHSKGGREDLFLADALKVVRDSSRVNERVDIVVTHIAAPYSKHVSDKGKRFAAPAGRMNGRAAKRGSDVLLSCSSCTDHPRPTRSSLANSRPRRSSEKRGSSCKRPSPEELGRWGCVG